MRVEDLRLVNIRNHEESAVRFLPGVNVLVGRNGQGKTSVLEAVSLLCLTRSFTASTDATLLRRSAEAFRVDGGLATDGGVIARVSVSYTAATREKIFSVDGLPAETMASVIGRFPAVVLAPEHAAVTAGGPADRRRFVDMLLSQAGRAYLQDLLEYRRVLRQRNRLLALPPHGPGAGESLSSWDTALVRAGARLMVRRARILADFRPYVREAYRILAGPGEEADMAYSSAPAVAGDDDEAVVEAGLRERLAHMRHEEVRRRASLVGPHRDDVRLEIGGLLAHQYASQGQHKSLLIALKMAEFIFLRERTGEAPVLLLDDVFSELDPVRARRLVDLVRDLGQTIITTTDDAGVRDVSAARFEVSHGTIGENTR